MNDDDDDIWTITGTEEPAPRVAPVTPDDYPAPDTDPGRGRFWTVGRVLTVVAVAVIVGVVAYLVANRTGDDKKVSASGDMAAGNEVPASDLWGRTWQVTRLEMGTDDPIPWTKEASTAALDLDLTVEGQVRFSGCNGGSGPATYTAGVLKATELVGTEMACEGDEGIQLMAYDEWMAGLLMDGVEVSFDDGILVLTGANGTAWLSGPGDITAPDPSGPTVTSTPDASGSSSPDSSAPDTPVGNDGLAANLWGSTWELRAITPADSLTARPLALLPDDTAPVIDTTETNRLTISGCNGTGGVVHLEGDKLVADGPWAQTKMACYRDLMDQEQFLTELLQAGPTVSVKDDLLTLAGDEFVVLAVRT